MQRLTILLQRFKKESIHLYMAILAFMFGIVFTIYGFDGTDANIPICIGLPLVLGAVWALVTINTNREKDGDEGLKQTGADQATDNQKAQS